MYSKKVMEHFKNPRNMGEIEDPDGLGEVGNPVCGDVMKLFIEVGGEDGEEVIENIMFKTFGCASAIATSSKITVLAKDKTIEQALEIDQEQIMESLGGLPDPKVHCSVLADDALKEAVYNYYQKQGREIPEELEEDHKVIRQKYEKTQEIREKLED